MSANSETTMEEALAMQLTPPPLPVTANNNSDVTPLHPLTTQSPPMEQPVLDDSLMALDLSQLPKEHKPREQITMKTKVLMIRFSEDNPQLSHRDVAKRFNVGVPAAYRILGRDRKAILDYAKELREEDLEERKRQPRGRSTLTITEFQAAFAKWCEQARHQGHTLTYELLLEHGPKIAHHCGRSDLPIDRDWLVRFAFDFGFTELTEGLVRPPPKPSSRSRRNTQTPRTSTPLPSWAEILDAFSTLDRYSVHKLAAMRPTLSTWRNKVEAQMNEETQAGSSMLSDLHSGSPNIDPSLLSIPSPDRLLSPSVQPVDEKGIKRALEQHAKLQMLDQRNVQARLHPVVNTDLEQKMHAASHCLTPSTIIMQQRTPEEDSVAAIAQSIKLLQHSGVTTGDCSLNSNHTGGLVELAKGASPKHE